MLGWLFQRYDISPNQRHEEVTNVIRKDVNSFSRFTGTRSMRRSGTSHMRATGVGAS